MMEAKIKMKQIDAALLQKMLIGGAKRLESNKEYINELNVFPVPDGDTGTNMTMTALAAAKEVGNAPEVTVKEVTRALSSGSLRGAEVTLELSYLSYSEDFTKVSRVKMF